MIGEARTVTGVATATKVNGDRVTLRPGTPVDQGDVIETGANSSVGLTFIDKTVFSLGANARMTLDDLVFSSTGSDHSAFTVLSGAFSFLTGEVAKTGPDAMRVRTPVATIGIRGTQVAGNDELIVLLSHDGIIGRVILNGTVILDQENQVFLSSGSTSFLSPNQVDTLFSGILRIIPLIRGALDSLDTNVAQLTDIQPQAGGGASFSGGGLQFVFFNRASLGLGLKITGPLEGALDFLSQAFPDTDSTPGTIIVPASVNAPPSAGDDSGAGTEAGGLDNVDPGQPTATGTFSDNVTDPDGGALTFEINPPGGTYGSVALNSATGDWTYTLNNSDTDTQALNASETATETFTYTVTDESGGTAAATLTITVTGRNDNPIASADGGGVTEAGGVNDAIGTPVATGTLGDNVSDVDNLGALGDDLDFSVVGGGTYGSLTLNTETGAWTYTLNNADTDTEILDQGQTALETFTYTVTDELGATATATLSITITGANDDPGATNDFGGPVSEAGGVNNAIPGTPSATGTLADNVTDVDDVDFNASGGGVYGSLKLDTETGSWTYALNNADSDTNALNAGQTALETYTYTVTDEGGATATATLTITVIGANDNPTAAHEQGFVVEAGGANNGVSGQPSTSASLSSNVSDVDNGGSLTDDLDFLLAGSSASATGTYGSLQLDTESGAWTYTLNNSDTDAQALNQGETATETFTYTVVDESGATATASIVINITGADDNPTASADGGGVTEAGGVNNPIGTPVATGTLGDNVSDVDNLGALGDDLDFSVVGGGTYGSLTLNTETGAWTYTLNNADTDTEILDQGQTALEIFTYTVTDELGATATATLSITITGANDNPGATNDFGGPVSEAGGINNAIPGTPSATGTLADNVTDVDDVDFNASGGGVYGSLKLDTETGSWTYALNNADSDTNALNAGQTALETHTYTVTDEGGATATATLTITVLGANDAPTANNEAGGPVTEDAAQASASGTLSNNVSDVDNAGTLTDDLDFSLAIDISAGVAQTYGSLALDTETGAWTYTLDNSDSDTQVLNEGESALEVYTYTVTDQSGATATATLTVTIVGNNDNPSATAEFGGPVSEDFASTASGTLSDNVSDVDNGGNLTDDLDFTAAGAGVYGSLALDTESGDWTYTLNNGDTDTDALGESETAVETFTYTVTDESGGTATQTLTITIVGVEDDTNPTATDDGGAVTEAGGIANGSAGTPTAAGTVADNVSDADGDELDFVLEGASGTSGETGGLYGSLGLDPDTGDWTYTLDNADTNTQALNGGESALDTFTYTVLDEDGATASATITVTVIGANDNPTANNDEGGAVTEAGAANGGVPTATGSLANNVSDVDSGGAQPDDVDFAGGGAGAYGSLVLDPDTGQWTFTLDNADGDTQVLNAGQTATDVFTYTVTDEDGATATATLSVLITGANDRPIATNETGGPVGLEAAAVALGSLSDNVTDIDNGGSLPDDLDFTASGGGSYGSLVLSTETGGWTYTLNSSDPDTLGLAGTQTAAETFTYTVTDESGATASATLTISIIGPDPNNNNFDGEATETSVSPADEHPNVIHGTTGNDTIDALNNNDTVYGGAGNDNIAEGGTGNDLIFAGSGNDTVDGGNQDDTIYGGSGNDVLDGDGNNDLLFGGSGADILLGDNNDDTLVGGYGADTLTGGNNIDAFRYLSLLDLGDLITDFASGTDALQFDASVFSALSFTGDTLDPGQFLSGAGLGANSANSASVNLIYDTTSGSLYYDADAQGGAAGVLVATLGTVTHPALQQTDIHPIV
jgi:VCBS repeat-containing protein